MDVAVLGTGIMGTGMTHALLRAGHRVTVWNRTPERAAPLASDGAEVADAVESAVSDAGVVITILFDADAVRAVAEQALPAMRDDAVWLQMSTIGPDAARDLEPLAARHGVRYLDAPVVGTKAPAEQGTLSAIVSGDAEAIETAREVLEALSSKITVAGPEIGQASALKLVCNAWTAVLTAGTAQSVALAEGAGLDPQLFLDVISGQATDSPMAQLKGAMMIKGQYPTAFAITSLSKDLSLIADLGRSTGVSTAVLEPLRAVLDAAAQAGHGGDDIAAVRTQF